MKQKDILVILIPAFIVTVLWVIFSVYHNYVTSTIKDPLTYQIIPIEGNFNIEGINKIKNRKNFNPAYNFEGGTSTTPTPTPSIINEDENIVTEDEISEDSLTPEISLTPPTTPTPTEEIIFEETEEE